MFHLLAQTYSYTTTPGGETTVVSSGQIVFWLILLVITVVGLWRVFQKAGKPGWAAIVPFYNIYLLLKIAGRPGWWLILFLIPIVNVVMEIVVGVDVAKKFGHSTVFGAIVCGILSIGYIIIGFDSSTYQGTAAAEQGPVPPAPTAQV